MASQDKLHLGLDIGASSVKFGYGDCKQGLQSFDKIELTEQSLPHLKQVCAQILDSVDSRVGLDSILSIGIGTCGTIDLQSGKLVHNPNLPYWVDLSPAELIPAELKIPVAFDNDANLMCLAEASLRYPESRVVGITVGSGIGCGYVQQGRIYHGSHGFAMELGHVNVCRDGVLCTCGRKGCLEAYAAVDGIKRRIRQALGSAISQGAFASLPELIRLQSQHPEIAQILASGANYLATAVANLIIVLDPDLLIFGGGAMDAGLYDFASLQEQIWDNLPALNRSHIRLEKAHEGNRAGVLGAIILAAQLISP